MKRTLHIQGALQFGGGQLQKFLGCIEKNRKKHPNQT